MTYIPSHLRQAVTERARYRCEYCQSLELITGGPMHIDHIIPQTQSGSTLFNNLALTCARCNLHKATRTHYKDPVSGLIVPLFNPRTQKWGRHFVWSEDGKRVLGRTQSGRATVIALNLNHPIIVMSRSIWVSLELHPPKD